MTARVQTYTVTIIPTVLFGLILINAGMTTADGQTAVDQEKTNKQVMKALDSGDTAAALRYLEKTVQAVPAGGSKNAFSYSHKWFSILNDTKVARIHVELVRSILQNLTG